MKGLVLVSVIVGILLLILAVVYWITPANSLPGVLPGFDSTLTTPHHKHAIGALLLSLAVFAFVWFNFKKSPA